MPDATYDNQNIFAKILRGELPCIKVYEDDHTVAFMDIMPQADGHVLVLPKEGAAELFDLSDDAASAAIRTTRKLARAVRAAFTPPGIAIFQLNGSAAGQTVPHRYPAATARPRAGRQRQAQGSGREDHRRTAGRISATVTARRMAPPNLPAPAGAGRLLRRSGRRSQHHHRRAGRCATTRRCHVAAPGDQQPARQRTGSHPHRRAHRRDDLDSAAEGRHRRAQPRTGHSARRPAAAVRAVLPRHPLAGAIRHAVWCAVEPVHRRAGQQPAGWADRVPARVSGLTQGLRTDPLCRRRTRCILPVVAQNLPIRGHHHQTDEAQQAARGVDVFGHGKARRRAFDRLTGQPEPHARRHVDRLARLEPDVLALMLLRDPQQPGLCGDGLGPCRPPAHRHARPVQFEYSDFAHD
ncbi:hypothetical protein Lal_00014405 [Lupinus albus]|nr:hypothetical protein Lal_00014405 [Lupinus albus]